jgi:CubicO group peptidase (beta-lactamase class C family)
MRSTLLLFVAIIFAVPAPAADTDAIRKNPEVQSTIGLIDSWIMSQMEYQQLPGLSIAVLYDTSLIWSKAYGVADLEKKTPMTTLSVFRIASITKTFTCTAIMQLRDQGKLRIDDPVAKYLPWFKYKNRFPAGAEVTLRMLMTHTSGLPGESAYPYWTDHQFPTREQIEEALPKQESIFESDTKFRYSNLGLAILGEVVTAASGEPYPQYIQKHILDPLGMKSTSVIPTADQLKHLVTPYGRKKADGSRAVSTFTDAKGLTAAANMSSTPEDLARYAAAHLQEGMLRTLLGMKGSTLREMHRPHWIQPSWRSGWGLGFSVTKSDERVTFGHGGWVGGNKSQLLVSPSEKTAVIVMINADDAVPSIFASRVMSALAPLMKRLGKPPAEPVKFDSSWYAYVGRYQDPWGWESEIREYNGKLVLYDHSYPPEDNPVGDLVTLYPEGPRVFRQSGDDGNGELVTFEVDAQGKVVRVKTGENYIYPALK